MRIYTDGTIIVDEGEAPVVVCARCQRLYWPTPGSFASRCRACGAANLHDEQMISEEEKQDVDHQTGQGSGTKQTGDVR